MIIPMTIQKIISNNETRFLECKIFLLYQWMVIERSALQAQDRANLALFKEPEKAKPGITCWDF